MCRENTARITIGRSKDIRQTALIFFPSIHIIGLPGTGKTTLAKKLARRWKMPVYRIGDYRKRFPSTVIGEADAWAALFFVLSRRKWRHCILETTGLNIRESFLKTALPALARLTIKLEAKRSILYQRIQKKKKENRSGEWFFSSSYADKRDFVCKLFSSFQKIPAH